MSAVREIAPSRLDQLAETINCEHQETTRALRSGLEHAVLAGAALYEAKAIVGRAGWRQWLRQNVSVSEVAANKYLRIYTHRERLQDANSIAGAIEILQQQELKVHTGMTPSQIAHVIERTDAGERVGDVAASIGVTPGAIYQQRKKRNRRARQAVELANRVRRTVKPGSAAAKAYAMAETLQDVLAQAEREAASSEARAAFSEAGEHYRKMRDAIVTGALR